MKTQHTPGPWVIANESVYADTPDDEGGIICEAPVGWFCSMKRWEANARLITAAPELLDFCIKFEKAVFPNMPQGGESLLSLFQGLAKEVIAKATNQTADAKI